MKKRKIYQGSALSDNYRPAQLPVYGEGLDTYIPSDYSMNTPSFVNQVREHCKSQLSTVAAITDQYTPGTVRDADVHVQMDKLREVQRKEEAFHDLQCKRISAAREVRKEALSARRSELSEQIDTRKEQIAPLKGLHAQFELNIGPVHIPLGPLVTLLALIVDSFINYGYFESIILQGGKMLWVSVICMGIMSDGSMAALGELISRKEEKFISPWLYRFLFGGFIGMFVLSVVSSVMIRFGSMDTTFGTINLAGEFVGKETYTLAEWGTTLVTAFLTACTGLLSFFFSNDKNAVKVSYRRKMEAELKNLEQEHTAVCKELSALEKAVDPCVLDQPLKLVANGNIDNLEWELDLYVRDLIAQTQADPNVTEAMAASSAELLTKDKTSIATIPTTQRKAV